MGVLHKFSALLFSCSCSQWFWIWYNNTKEGAYILFSLSNSTTITSTINSYLTALKLLNAFLSTIQYKCAPYECLHLKGGATTFQSISKFVCWRCPTVLPAPHASSHDEWAMLLHQASCEQAFTQIWTKHMFTFVP